MDRFESAGSSTTGHAATQPIPPGRMCGQVQVSYDSPTKITNFRERWVLPGRTVCYVPAIFWRRNRWEIRRLPAGWPGTAFQGLSSSRQG